MDASHEGLPVADLPGVPNLPVEIAAPRKPVPTAAVGTGAEPIPPAPIQAQEPGERRGPLNLLRNLFGGGG